MLDIDNILVPTDFSGYADRALKKAIGLAQKFDAQIHLAYVVPDAPDIFKLSKYMTEGREQIQIELERKCETYFKDQLAKFPEAAETKIKQVVLNGVPVKEILDYEKRIKADVVVIATQGETALEDFIFGGTSSKIIRHAKSSVFVVRKAKYS